MSSIEGVTVVLSSVASTVPPMVVDLLLRDGGLTNYTTGGAHTAGPPSLGISYGHTRHTFNALALLLLPLLCFVGLVGNAFVCVAIATDRRLQNVTNYFLFSLALADLLVCCIVMPMSIIVEVKQGVWTWSFHVCLLYVYADVFLCSASIVHMSVISLDRYLGISQPLKTRNKSKTAIIIKIVLVWLITILISSPLAIAAFRDPTNVLQNEQCMVHNRYYMIYGSTLSFLIPFFIMAITYVRTTNLLNKQANVLSQSTKEKGGGLRRAMPAKRINSRKESGTSSSKPSTASYPPAVGWQGKAANNANAYRAIQAANEEQMHKHSSMHRWRSRTSTYFSSLVTRVSRRSSLQSTNQELLSEHKATRVLAVVFVCFFICWTPFFAANFVNGFCGLMCTLPPWLGSLFLWLGYVSSTINPIIYTIFNKRFRQAFIRILRGRCLRGRRDLSSHYSRTHTILPDTYSIYDRTLIREENGDGPRSKTSENGVAKSVFFDDEGWVRKKDSTTSRTPALKHKSNGGIIRRGTLEDDEDDVTSMVLPYPEHRLYHEYDDIRPLIFTSTSRLCSPDAMIDGLTLKRSFTSNLVSPEARPLLHNTKRGMASESNVTRGGQSTRCLLDSSPEEVLSTSPHLTLIGSGPNGDSYKETFL